MDIKSISCDIAVIGGGPSGVAAAITASRSGAKVLLAERSGHLGGGLVTGLPLLGYLDKQGRQVSGGFSQELIDRLSQRSATYGHNRCPMHNSVTIIDSEATKLLLFEMCAEAGVQLLLHCEATEVIMEASRITGVILSGKGNKCRVNAKIFIDGTGDGDVAYMAGATCYKGQENTGVLQPPSLLFRIANFSEQLFLSYLESHPKDLVPSESMKVSSGYDVQFFRNHPGYVFLGLRDTLDNMRRQGVEPLKRDTLIFIKTMHDGEICVNSTRVLNFDGSLLTDLTRGEQEGMRQAYEIHEFLSENIPGFKGSWISHINDGIGVRETRRFSGMKCLTISGVVGGEIPRDSVALGAYKVDIHNGTDSTTILTDLEEPYGIPLGCLISDEIDGLMLSGRCISMDAPSLASARVMPTCMCIGQAAGVCAAIAIQDGVSPESVKYENVVEILKSQGAILAV